MILCNLALEIEHLLPDGYLERVAEGLPADIFGGPDRADVNFTPLQKAIDYAMTSPLTTGGIRGRKKSADRFFPRSFNMGIRREVFEAVGGFAPMRFGEDIDLSYRVVEAGYGTKLLPEAWVYHKRRTSMRQFFKQVYNSGAARVELTKRHPGTLRVVHLLPAAFVVGCVVALIVAIFWPWALLAFAAFAATIFADAAVRTRNIRVAALSIITSFVQLAGYGCGFLLRRNAFTKTFYK